MDRSMMGLKFPRRIQTPPLPGALGSQLGWHIRPRGNARGRTYKIPLIISWSDRGIVPMLSAARSSPTAHKPKRQNASSHRLDYAYHPQPKDYTSQVDTGIFRSPSIELG
ncbi:hypothetical protein M422DRAFT_26130 [Sphaerobolus stellatus SS14]|nr:hypothetical protein M422DRAFT_26130 [Sphaerobolus stellatus SS14]